MPETESKRAMCEECSHPIPEIAPRQRIATALWTAHGSPARLNTMSLPTSVSVETPLVYAGDQGAAPKLARKVQHVSERKTNAPEGAFRGR